MSMVSKLLAPPPLVFHSLAKLKHLGIYVCFLIVTATEYYVVLIVG